MSTTSRTLTLADLVELAKHFKNPASITIWACPGDADSYDMSKPVVNYTAGAISEIQPDGGISVVLTYE